MEVSKNSACSAVGGWTGGSWAAANTAAPASAVAKTSACFKGIVGPVVWSRNVLPPPSGCKPSPRTKKRASPVLQGTPARRGVADRRGVRTPKWWPDLSAATASTVAEALAAFLASLPSALLQLAHLVALLRCQDLQNVRVDSGAPDQCVRLE